MVMYTFNPSSWEIKADRSLGFEASLVYISKFQVTQGYNETWSCKEEKKILLHSYLVIK